MEWFWYLGVLLVVGLLVFVLIRSGTLGLITAIALGIVAFLALVLVVRAVVPRIIDYEPRPSSWTIANCDARSNGDWLNVEKSLDAKKCVYGQFGTAQSPSATQPPATQVPATQAPATQVPPTTVPPATQAPATQVPATQVTSSGAGQAPQNVDDAARVLGVNTPQFLTSLYARAGDPTAIGWVIGTSASESAGTKVSARTIPAGTCVDYDHNASRLSGDVERSERLTGNWTRALLRSQGSFEGLKATIYWTPCVFSTGGPTTTAGSGPASAQTTTTQQPAAQQPQSTTLACKDVNPSGSVGGNWKFVSGNMWSLTGGSQSVHGAEGWTVHTPGYPGGNGLPQGKSETTSAASAYNMSCQQ